MDMHEFGESTKMRPTASVKTLSQKYDIKARTIREWMTQRKFAWYKPAKLVLIDVSSFEAFLFRNKFEPLKPEIIKDRIWRLP